MYTGSMYKRSCLEDWNETTQLIRKILIARHNYQVSMNTSTEKGVKVDRLYTTMNMISK